MANVYENIGKLFSQIIGVVEVLFADDPQFTKKFDEDVNGRLEELSPEQLDALMARLASASGQERFSALRKTIEDLFA